MVPLRTKALERKSVMLGRACFLPLFLANTFDHVFSCCFSPLRSALKHDRSILASLSKIISKHCLKLPPYTQTMQNLSSCSLSLTSAALNGFSLNGGPRGCSESSGTLEETSEAVIPLWSTSPYWTPVRGQLLNIPNCNSASSPSFPVELSTVVASAFFFFGLILPTGFGD